jgi:DNA-binding response OmpR family regulator
MLTVLVANRSSGPRCLVADALVPTFRVLAVADGRSALGILQRGRVDLAVLSLDLGEIRATDVAQRLRDAGITTPLIVTGRSEERLRVASRLPNVFLTVRSPLQPVEVQWAVARALGRRVTWQDDLVVVG